MALIDKGYYDYDYEERKRQVYASMKPKSKEEVASMLARFGFATKIGSSAKKPLTPEEMQRIAMEEAKDSRK